MTTEKMNVHKALAELKILDDRIVKAINSAGAFQTECNKEEINPDMEDLTNVPNPHQDTLRYGKLNVEELHERCQADTKTAGLPCQKTLAITHMNECGKIALSVRDTFKDDWEVKYLYFEVN